MKFMKLGSKPDTLLADGNNIRYVLSELETDIILNVDEVKFYLHKFPLLSKSNCLQKLVLRANEENSDEIYLNNFPGGPKAFEICTKFCYGMAVTLNAYNVVAARCGAEYLEMTEDVEKGNLIFKIEVFLNSSVFRSWKDSIIVLQTTKSLLPWSEEVKIIGRCVDSIASKTSVDPSNINWSYTSNRKPATPDASMEKVPKDWWAEDICDLDIDLYKRTMIAIKSRGRMGGLAIGEALKAYTIRWLPDSIEALVSEKHVRSNKSLVETIIFLLPPEGTGCTCSFLLKLLKVSMLVGADESVREDLVARISLKVDEASVNDLLIPAQCPQATVYDVELVERIINRFFIREKSNPEPEIFGRTSEGNVDAVLGHRSWLKIGKLVDDYLGEVAGDPNLSLSRFISLAQMIPESSRLVHDELYRAIDIYMEEHPNMTKADRKKICGLMDVKKLSPGMSMHAAQNERLPLRVIVQVLFFEQLRTAAATADRAKVRSNDASRSTSNTEEEWEKNEAECCPSLLKQMSQLKTRDDEFRNSGRSAPEKIGKRQLVPSRSRRIFDKLWVVRKGSETSGSSRSPTSLILGDTKSANGLDSKQRRYSVS